jgi:hypothetical protein
MRPLMVLPFQLVASAAISFAEDETGLDPEPCAAVWIFRAGHLR